MSVGIDPLLTPLGWVLPQASYNCRVNALPLASVVQEVLRHVR
jgi:hypothetical protein